MTVYETIYGLDGGFGLPSAVTAVIVLATTKMLAQDPPHWVTETIPVVFAYCQPQFTTGIHIQETPVKTGDLEPTGLVCPGVTQMIMFQAPPYKEGQTTSGIQMRQK